MPVWDCDAACGLCGEVLDRWGDLPFVVVVGVTGSFVTSQFATPSAPLSLSSLPFPANWRSPASCSLPGPLTPVAPVLAPTSLLIPTPPLAAGAAPQTFGSSGEPQASLRPGTSRSRPSFAPPFSPQPLVFHEVETRKNSFQNTASQMAAFGATFRPLVLEACGGGGPKPCVRLSRGFPRAPRVASDTPRDVSLRIAQRISCTLHRENARAILRRPPEAVNGSSGLTGVQVSGTVW